MNIFEQNNTNLKIEVEPMLGGNNNPNNTGISEVDIALDTLEEPVYQTIWRDIKSVATKVSVVLIPRPSKLDELKNCKYFYLKFRGFMGSFIFLFNFSNYFSNFSKKRTNSIGFCRYICSCLAWIFNCYN